MTSTTALDVAAEVGFEAQRLFRAFLEASPDAVVLIDASGQIVHANAGVEELFGYRRDELLGRPLDVLIPERFRSRHAGHRRSYFATGPTRRMGSGNELFGLRKDGSEFPIDVALSRSPAQAGDLVAAAVRDVTGYRSLEAELRRQNRVLQDADQHKDRFLAMLAHELRSPLAALSQVARLLRIPALEDRRDWAAGIVERQTGDMLRLVEDLLDVARVRQGKIKLHREPTDLVRVAVRAVESTRAIIEGRKHSLVITLPAEPIWIDGDATRLVQVVANLLTNAARYTPEGGLITLELVTEDGHALLRVRDNGIGIIAEMLPQVFELFTQVRGVDGAASGGLGLGLALVRRLVEMHGGTVIANSAGPGLGCEFVVRLSLCPTSP